MTERKGLTAGKDRKNLFKTNMQNNELINDFTNLSLGKNTNRCATGFNAIPAFLTLEEKRSFYCFGSIRQEIPPTLENYLVDNLLEILYSDANIEPFEQTIFKSILTPIGVVYQTDFSQTDLILRSRKSSLTFSESSSKFKWDISCVYTTTQLRHCKNRKQSLKPSYEQFVRHSIPLFAHYDFHMPYLEGAQTFFNNYNMSKFQISARSCNSRFLKIATKVEYSTRASFSNDYDDTVTRLIYKEEETKDVPYIEQFNDANYSDMYAQIGDINLPKGVVDQFAPKLDALLNQSNLTAKTVGESATKMKDTFEKVVDLAETFLDKMKPEELHTMMEKTKEQFKPANVMSGCLESLSVIGLLVTATQLAIYKDKNSFSMFIPALLASIYFNKKRVSKLLSHLINHLVKTNEPVAQAGEDEDKPNLSVDDFFTGIICSLSGMMFANTPWTKVPEKALKSIGDFPRLKTSMKDLMDFFVRVFDTLLSYLPGDLSIPKWMKYVNISQNEIKEIFDGIDEINKEKIEGGFTIDESNDARIKALLDRARDAVLNMRGISPNVLSMLNSQVTWLTRFREKNFVDSGYRKSGLRQMPVVTVLVGESRTGKSQTLEWLSWRLASETLPVSERKHFRDKPSNYVFPRHHEAVYWDTYHGQKVCTHDDFLSLRDVAGVADSETVAIIREADELCYPLHMAKLEDKGTTFFTSHFINLTTNAWDMRPKIESINNPDAMINRIDFAFQPFPKPEFSKVEVDKNGVKKIVVDETKMEYRLNSAGRLVSVLAPRDYLLYRPYCFKTAKTLGGEVTYDEMVGMIISKYLQNKDRYEAKIDRLLEEDSNIVPLESLERPTDENGRYFTRFYDNENYIEEFRDSQESLEETLSESSGLMPHGFLYDNAALEKATLDVMSVSSDVVYDSRAIDDCLQMQTMVSQVGKPLLRSKEKAKKFSRVINLETMFPKYSKKGGVAKPEVEIIRLCRNKVLDLGDTEKYLLVSNFIDFREIIRTKRHDLAHLSDPELIRHMLKADIDVLDKMYKNRLEYKEFRQLSRDIKLDPIHQDCEDAPFYLQWWNLFSATVKMVSSTIYNDFASACCRAIKWIRQNYDYIVLVLLFVVNPLIMAATSWFSYEKGKNVGAVEENASHQDFISDYSTYWEETLRRARNGDENPRLHDEYSEAQSLPQHKPKGQKTRVFRPRTTIAGENFIGQMGCVRDKNGYDLVTSKISTNCYHLVIETKTSVFKLGWVTFIRDRLAIMPHHFKLLIEQYVEVGDMALDDKVVLTCYKPGIRGEKKIFMTLEEFGLCSYSSTIAEDRDLILLEFPKSHCHIHTDIRKLFPKSKDLLDKNNLEINLVIPGERFSDKCSRAVTRNNHAYNLEKDSDVKIMISDGLVYKIATKAGDCGAWVTLMDPTKDYKLIGFHSAGDGVGFGFGVTVTREDLDSMIDEISSQPGLGAFKQHCQENPFPELDDSCGEMVAEGQFIELFKPDEKPFNSGKSNIRTTYLKDTYMQAKTAPAKLRPFEINGYRVDPLKMALEKCCLPNLFLDKKMVTNARMLYQNTLEQYDLDVERRIYTFEEAVLGLEGDPDFKSLSRATSSGYPWNCRGYKKKYTFFGADEAYDLERDEAKKLKALVFQIIEYAAQGVRYPTIYSSTLKCERRPIEKAENGITRLFSASPVQCSCAYRMYFGAFTLWYHKNRILNGSAIGVNPYGVEWNDIVKQLLKNGASYDTCIGAGDFKRYDGSQKSMIHWAILEIIQDFYDDGPVNAKIRETLWLDLTNSYQLIDGVVVMWPCGLPSGNVMTLVVNTMYQHIAARCAWIMATEGTSYLPTQFDEFVYLIVMGDDGVLSVAPEVRDIFNEMTLCTFYERIGLTYTTELKEKATVPLRKITDVSFLKRTFRFAPDVGRYVAPLELDVILEIPMWCKEGDELETVDSNVNLALKELTLHGKEVYDKWAKKIIFNYRKFYNAAPKHIHYVHNLQEMCNTVAPY